MRALDEFASRLRQLWSNDIWAVSDPNDRGFRGRAFAILRVISITLSGLGEIKVAARAAALSYSTLLGLGPMVALAVLIAGFALDDRDPAMLARNLHQVVSFIAPQIAQTDNAATEVATDHEFVQLINHFVASSRSGTAGVVGVLTLLVIAVQLFSTIENAFNDIWGVRRGRSWLMRVVYYWTVVTLGALLFFTSLTLFSAGTFASVLVDFLPATQHLAHHVQAASKWILPPSSALLLIVVLTLFYRLVPNTRVRWTAALVGAITVTVLLLLNNALAFLYFKRVMLSRSLYGSVAILPILMLGLYVFWFIVLVGGQITYAVQNVRYRSSQTAWNNLNTASRESLSLVVLLLIARRFKDCRPPLSVSQLSLRIKVPSQVLNECLNRLSDLDLVAQLPSNEARDPGDYRYQPARPLNRITLLEFQRMFSHYGASPSGDLLDTVDPVLAHYHERLAFGLGNSLGDRSLDELMDAFPEPDLASR